MKPQLTFSLTREQFEAARARCASNGVNLIGDCGDVEGHKVGVTFNYVEPKLTLTVEHKPWIYPESEVESEITNWFASL